MKFAPIPCAVALGILSLLGSSSCVHAQDIGYNYPYYTFSRESAVNPVTNSYGYSIGYASYDDWRLGRNPGSPVITFNDPNQFFNKGYLWNRSTLNYLNSSGGFGWQVCDNATLNFRGGRLINNGSADGNIISWANSHLSISGGIIENYVAAAGSSTVDITGGIIGDALSVQGNSTVTMSGGTVRRVSCSQGSSFTFSGGTITGELGFFSEGFVTMTGGSIGGQVILQDVANRMYVKGGSIGGTVNVSRGKFYLMGGTTNSNIQVAGGTSEGVMYFYGGRVNGDFVLNNDGRVSLMSGNFGGGAVIASAGGTLHLYGTGLNAVLTDPNGFWSGYYGGGGYREYTLSGVMRDGIDITGKKIYLYPTETARFFLHNTTTATGTVAVNGLAASQTATLTFQPEDGSPAFTHTVNVSSTPGSFSIANLIPQRYAVRVTADRALAKNVVIDTTSGDVSEIMADLSLGDANGDNAIDIADLLLLVGHYNQVAPNAGYLAGADFNGDGINDITDLLLLIGNYNLLGDS